MNRYYLCRLWAKRFSVERDENARWHFFRKHHASKNKRIRTWGTIIKPHCWILLKYIHWIAAQKSQVLFIRLSSMIPKILSPFIGANSTITRSLPTGKLASLPCQLPSSIPHFWTTQIKCACVVMACCTVLADGWPLASKGLNSLVNFCKLRHLLVQ